MDTGTLVMDKEKAMWDAVIARDVPRFQQLVRPDAVMICGGMECTGAEYAGFVRDFNITGCQLRDMAVTHADEGCVHLRYVVETTVEGPENDLSGAFYVSSLWERTGQDWQLVFNMDARVFPA